MLDMYVIGVLVQTTFNTELEFASANELFE